MVNRDRYALAAGCTSATSTPDPRLRADSPSEHR